MAAYYNDHDPEVCEWLRELIRAGLIADGDVDERSILDIRPDDLRGFVQCHFFAGIGGWSYALRLAGVPDDFPAWTGSPPCQPFSAAGQRKGRDDARHLGPHFVSLVGACRPPVLFGEQVASSDVFGKAASRAAKAAPGQPAWAWVDDLCDRLEAARYAVGSGDIPAAGVGAPHIRQRCFFGAVMLADGDDPRLEGREQPGRERAAELAAGPGGVVGGLGNAESRRESGGLRERRQAERAKVAIGGYGSLGWLEHDAGDGREQRRPEPDGRGAAGGCGDGGLGDCQRIGRKAIQPEGCRGVGGRRDDERSWLRLGPRGATGLVGDVTVGWPGADHDPWRDADWLYCRDGKWRPVEPGTFPLAHGIPGRVGLLRGYGNAIVPQAAAAFVQAFVDVMGAADAA